MSERSISYKLGGFDINKQINKLIAEFYPKKNQAGWR